MTDRNTSGDVAEARWIIHAAAQPFDRCTNTRPPKFPRKTARPRGEDPPNARRTDRFGVSLRNGGKYARNSPRRQPEL